MASPRQAKVNITYIPKGESRSRTASALAPYIESFSYVDAASGESDTFSLKLSNVDLKWCNRWLPEIGDKIKATIKTESWDTAGRTKSYPCGKFCCDDMQFSGPTLTCTINGTSVPECQDFRATERTYTWQIVTLQEMAQAIADKYYLTLVYDAGEVKIETIEQTEETDCEFLNRVCEEYGLVMKVYYGKLIIYDIGLYEDERSVATYSIKKFQSWEYEAALTGTYTGAVLTYTNGDDDTEIEMSVGLEGRMLTVTEEVDNADDAFRKACAAVNKENRSAVTMTATIRANLKLAAGRCIYVTGAYELNGKYFIDKITHNIGGSTGYTMDLELHKVQDRIDFITPLPEATETPSTAETVTEGEAVTVNGPVYYAATGGLSEAYSDTRMYIADIAPAGPYKYGVSKRQGGECIGYVSPDSIREV
ncbi:MAG: hypothetical protein LUC16_01490 [Coprobacillus sp.]|nr:hypothetical protein [Coprobacillus sp.]